MLINRTGTRFLSGFFIRNRPYPAIVEGVKSYNGMAGILSQGGILMQSSLIEEKLNKRRRWLWYLYDVGNSAYAAVVILAIYAAYF
jgi:hypothetical protein